MITEDSVRLLLRTVMDPELSHDIVTLGIVHEIEVEGSDVDVTLQVTSPNCPFRDELVRRVDTAVRTIPGIGKVCVEMASR